MFNEIKGAIHHRTRESEDGDVLVVTMPEIVSQQALGEDGHERLNYGANK